MAEPALVADCVAAMKAAVKIPVTVKCRIGIDEQDPDQALFAFAAAVKAAGADALIVHARKAWLKGLSPRENREVPPLDYALVHRLKRAHPDLEIVLNGGIASLEQAQAQLGAVDGVMMGRAAYQEPWRLLAGRSFALWPAGAFCLAERGRAGAHPLYRARIGQGRAAACHHPPRARPVPQRSGRARLPPPSGDRSGQARRRRSVMADALALVLDTATDLSNIAA